MARLAMLIDLTRCVGCDACTVACKQENGTPADAFFARVLNIEAGAYPDVKRVYLPVLCNHCENPACLKACPNKAIYRRDDGIVLVDQDRCRGTGACVSACPYGNIVLKAEDEWYLPEDRAYERDFVKPRLKPNVARKCTLCAHRVDRGLEPACAVACPTTARIFGDTEDPESKISRYIAAQKAQTGRDPFKLLPECGTEPANMYLGTMAAQQSSAGEGENRTTESTEGHEEDSGFGIRDSGRDDRRPSVKTLGLLALVVLLALLAPGARAQSPASAEDDAEVWSSSACAGCHGPNAMGGLGPPLAGTRLNPEQFRAIVRKGRGMMPAVPAKEAPDAEIDAVYRHARATKLDPAQIPVSYRIGALLTTRNVGLIFMGVTLVAFALALKVLLYWLNCAGWRQLRPTLRRFGYARAAAVFARALVVDGLLVASLWRKDKFRWAMHGLMLYGFVGLSLADMLMQIFNPLRSALPLTHPLKLLPNLSGLAILGGIVYVNFRYGADEYIDNGLTLGRDYLFLNLLALVILTGFLVEGMGYANAAMWVQPAYMLHLALVATLFVTAPFTRFSHAFVVPVLIGMTKLTGAVAASGTDLGFAFEPSPGRHHKSQRLAEYALKTLDPDFHGPVRLRYYP